MTQTAEVIKRSAPFSDYMLRAILNDRKTQDRWVVDLRDDDYQNCRRLPQNSEMVWRFDKSDAGATGWEDQVCPYGQPGDKLWVPETWRITGGGDWHGVIYRADEDRLPVEKTLRSMGLDRLGRKTVSRDDWHQVMQTGTKACNWRPSSHMPRWASRITLEVTGVRVERLQKIIPTDAIAEGFFTTNDRALLREAARLVGGPYPRGLFAVSWNATNKPEHNWDANPWVWVRLYKRTISGR